MTTHGFGMNLAKQPVVILDGFAANKIHTQQNIQHAAEPSRRKTIDVQIGP